MMMMRITVQRYESMYEDVGEQQTTMILVSMYGIIWKQQPRKYVRTYGHPC